MHFGQAKCTTQNYSAFNLPLVAFSLSGEMQLGADTGISPPLKNAVEPLESHARFSRASNGLAPRFSPSSTLNHPESSSEKFGDRTCSPSAHFEAIHNRSSSPLIQKSGIRVGYLYKL